MCKLMLNPLQELLHLKTKGFRLWAPDGAGERLREKLFVDDATIIQESNSQMSNAATFTYVYTDINGTQVKVHKLKKTVYSALTWTGGGGRWKAKDAQGAIYCGDQKIPRLSINQSYEYLGTATRLDGMHEVEIQKKVIAKADLVVAEEACHTGPRGAVVHNLNADIMGNGLWHGATYCPSFQTLDKILGRER